MRHHKVEYGSDYLVPGVAVPGASFHIVGLSWDRDHPEAVGSFFVDPNLCGLDAFGDPKGCTKMAVSLHDMKLTLFAEKPEHQAYTVETRPHGSTDGFTALPLRLVTSSLNNGQPQVRLLVVGADQTIERIIDLHRPHA